MEKLIGLVTDKRYLQHKTGYFHPESPERLIAIEKRLNNSNLPLLRIEPRLASKEELLLVHTPEYIDIVEQDIKAGKNYLSTGDTNICAKSLQIAKLAAGGVLAACDAIMEGKVNCVFCAIRPPGHHAESNRGMGFCIFNNVAIAARYLQNKYKLQNILIVDWDYHHGNGTQEIFYEDNTVLYFSTHQKYDYPGTGSDNVNLEPGSGDKEIIYAIKYKLLPNMQSFRPEFIIISAGFDSRHGDPIGKFNITDNGFAEITKIVKGIADKYCNGRILSVLEGGYNPDGLAKAVEAHMRAMSSNNILS